MDENERVDNFIEFQRNIDALKPIIGKDRHVYSFEPKNWDWKIIEEMKKKKFTSMQEK